MNMKIKALALLPTIAFALVGCSKDEEQSFDYDVNLIYGTWRVTHVFSEDHYVNVVGTIHESWFEPTYITFNPNGSYSGEGYFGEGEGTYKTFGETVVTYIGGKEYARYDILSLSGTAAEAEMYYSNDPTDRLKFKVTNNLVRPNAARGDALGFVFGDSRGDIQIDLSAISPEFSETPYAWRQENKSPVSLLEFDGDRLIRLYCKDQGNGLDGICAEYGIPSELQYDRNDDITPQQWDNGKLKFKVFSADPAYAILGGTSPASRRYLTIEKL